MKTSTIRMAVIAVVLIAAAWLGGRVPASQTARAQDAVTETVAPPDDGAVVDTSGAFVDPEEDSIVVVATPTPEPTPTDETPVIDGTIAPNVEDSPTLLPDTLAGQQ